MARDPYAPGPDSQTQDPGNPGGDYTRCPPGQFGDNGAYGPNCKPADVHGGPAAPPVAFVPGGSTTGGSTFPSGAAYDFSNLVNPNWNIISRYNQRSPFETAALKSVSGLASALAAGGGSLFGAGFPGYSAGMNYLTTLLSGSKPAVARAIGPQAGAMSDIYSGAERSLEAGPLRGGALETAKAELGREKAANIGNLIPQAQQAAVAGATSAGLAGAQAGVGAGTAAAGIQGQVASLEQANRQFGISAEQANRFGAAGIGTQNRALDIQAILGDRGLSIQENLGTRALELQGKQLDLSTWYQQQIIDLTKQQIQYQQEAAKGNMFGGLLGALIGKIPVGSGGGGGGTGLLAPPY